MYSYNQCFFANGSFLGHCKKILDFFVQRTKKKSILFMHFHTKIAEILSSTYKIEHFSRFLGQNAYF